MPKPINIIERESRWFFFDFKAFFEYRDLLFLLVRKEIVSKYQQTLMGPLWYLLQPLLMTGVFFFVFTKTLHISTGKIPPVLFYLSGLLVWNYTSQTLNATSMALVSNAGLFKKVYFPRVMMPLSQVLFFLFTFCFQTIVFLGFYLYYKNFTEWGDLIQPNAWIFYFPFFLLQVGALTLGLGLWVSSLTIRFRDFHHLLSLFLTLWMYASPISYPAERVPLDWSFALLLNPLTPAIESLRLGFFGQGRVDPLGLGVTLSFSVLALMSGLFYFHRVERTLIDKI